MHAPDAEPGVGPSRPVASPSPSDRLDTRAPFEPPPPAPLLPRWLRAMGRTSAVRGPAWFRFITGLGAAAAAFNLAVGLVVEGFTLKAASSALLVVFLWLQFSGYTFRHKRLALASLVLFAIVLALGIVRLLT